MNVRFTTVVSRQYGLAAAAITDFQPALRRLGQASKQYGYSQGERSLIVLFGLVGHASCRKTTTPASLSLTLRLDGNLPRL
jgi:hypothetical protein